MSRFYHVETMLCSRFRFANAVRECVVYSRPGAINVNSAEINENREGQQTRRRNSFIVCWRRGDCFHVSSLPACPSIVLDYIVRSSCGVISCVVAPSAAFALQSFPRVMTSLHSLLAKPFTGSGSGDASRAAQTWKSQSQTDDWRFQSRTADRPTRIGEKLLSTQAFFLHSPAMRTIRLSRCLGAQGKLSLAMCTD